MDTLCANDGKQATRIAGGSRLAVAVGVGLLLHTTVSGGQTLEDSNLQVETVVTGLSQPTTMDFLDSDDILVLEKGTGIVQRVQAGGFSPVLDVAVHSRSERGLLGIAINSQIPPAVFLYYTESSTGNDTSSPGSTPLGNSIYRYDWNPITGLLESPQLIRDLPVTPGPNHNGGILVLGPTGEGSVGDGRLLYAVIGDLNRDGQLENFPTGDEPDDTAVILRIEQDGSAAAGNPFTPYCSVTTGMTCVDDLDCPPSERCTTEVASYFAYGVRNSFGLVLDPETELLWDTENGPGSYDEVNLIEPGTNSGWQRIMGPDSRDPQGTADLFDMPGAGSTYSDPEFSWFDTVAPTAIVFPAGSALGPDYDDVVLVGDNNSGQIYAFPLNGLRNGFDFTDPSLSDLQDLVADSQSEANLLRFGSGFGVVTDLKIGLDGALYVTSLSQGAIYRVVPEPSTTLLLMFQSLGLAGLAARRRRLN